MYKTTGSNSMRWPYDKPRYPLEEEEYIFGRYIRSNDGREYIITNEPFIPQKWEIDDGWIDKDCLDDDGLYWQYRWYANYREEDCTFNGLCSDEYFRTFKDCYNNLKKYYKGDAFTEVSEEAARQIQAGIHNEGNNK